MTMDRRERLNDPSGALMAAFAGLQAGIWTGFPAQVNRVNVSGGKLVSLDLQPVIQARRMLQDDSYSWETLPVLLDCPVIWPQAGDFALTFPVKAGDEVFCLIANRCIDYWFEAGGIRTQYDLRMHDLSDGFALLGVSSKPNLFPDYSGSAVELRDRAGDNKIGIDADGRVYAVSTNKIQLSAPTIEITGTVNLTGSMTSTGDVTAAGISLAHHRHPGDSGGTTGEPE